MRLLPLALAAALMAPAAFGQSVVQWPAISRTTKPWTRWWWLGSGVDQPNLERMLRELHAAGEGGVEICPIYGAKGYEARFIPYLSPRWMDMLAFTTRTAAALDMGVDLTTGTGWPMGGPWVPDDEASAHLTVRRLRCPPDGAVDAALFAPPGGRRRPASDLDGMLSGIGPRQTAVCVRALAPDGREEDLTERVGLDGRLRWRAPGPGWVIYAAVMLQPVQQVKRAAPGDQGNVIDPYSVRSLDTFLARFTEAFQGFSAPRPRAEFHDSFEYFGANWTPDLFTVFALRRGYDLRDHLPALAGDGDPDEAARVREDYRRTIAELHREWVAHWTEWSHRQGSLTREQAHGAPANIEDVYAAADIPETEGAFGGGTDDQVPMMKFASSAAHVTGRRLASSETFTWLGEHFSVPLSALKPVADRFFLAGTNHLFFHGTPYSPADAPWPGWLFYASVNFGPEGGIWHDLPAFNAYAARCQSILQGGRPDNDVLLYFPVADFWQQAAPPATTGARHGPDPLVEQFTTPGKWLEGSPFQAVALELWRRGYGFDEVTDELLAPARVAGSGRIALGGGTYGAIVIPSCRRMPIATLRQLLALRKAGAAVIFQGRLPDDVPGFGEAASRRRTLREMERAGGLAPFASAGEALESAGLAREAMTDQGLQVLRRRRDDGGDDYFIVNRSGHAIDGWVPFARRFASAVLMDPLQPARVAAPELRAAPAGGSVWPGGSGGDAAAAGKPGPNPRQDRTLVYLQMPPDGSLIVRTAIPGNPALSRWAYTEAQPEGRRALTGAWSVVFTEGGPVLPRPFTTDALASWTDRPDPEAKRFAGTAVYRLEFSFDPSAAANAADWRLDLGRVDYSARVSLNGHDLGTLWCPPFALDVGRWLRPGANRLRVEVTNLAANRIADLDRRHVPWKNFYEINFVDRAYRPFDASAWPLSPSGLLGPVTLTPLRSLPPRMRPARRNGAGESGL